MGGGGTGTSMKSNPTKARKRVEADSGASYAPAASMVRAKDGSAFARCEECNKDVAIALISFHSCSLDAKIKMNLEAQVVEKPAETKKKPTDRKKASSTEPKAKKVKREKKADNPNKPKRPPTAFFLFMDDFRKDFKAANPDSKDVKRVAKEGGEKWKSMTDEEKKQYLDKAAELKAEYDKAVEEAKNADNEDDDGGSEKEEPEQEVQEVQEVSDGE